MPYLRETYVGSDPRDTHFQRPARDFINRMKPYQANTIRFQADAPAPSNTVDVWAPAVLAVLLVGFLVMK